MDRSATDTHQFKLLAAGWIGGFIMGVGALLGTLMYASAPPDGYVDSPGHAYDVSGEECLADEAARSAMGSAKWHVIQVTHSAGLARISVMTDLESVKESLKSGGPVVTLTAFCVQLPAGFTVPRMVRYQEGTIVSAD